MTEEIYDVEAEPGTDLETFRDTKPASLFGTDEPRVIIAKASGVADALKDVIVKQRLSVRIGLSDYVKVEGWTTLGALLGVFARTQWTRELTDGEGNSLGWEAAVEVVTGAGAVIGRAEAQCLRDERNWKGRDDFALRSMAQTRAMGKALRMPLGWIAVMAGYEATPAEEMPGVTPSTQSDDVPFDETGGAQGRDADSRTAHGSGTDAASTTELQHSTTDLLFNLRRRLAQLDTDGEKEIEKHAKLHADRPDLFQKWIRRQIRMADEALAAKDD